MYSSQFPEFALFSPPKCGQSGLQSTYQKYYSVDTIISLRPVHHAQIPFFSDIQFKIFGLHVSYIY